MVKNSSSPVTIAFFFVSLFFSLEGMAQATNVALGKSYTLNPSANYLHPNYTAENYYLTDDVDLTDGDVSAAASHGSTGSVTWRQLSKIGIVIDLEKANCMNDIADCHAISEIRVNVRDQLGAAGVYCPKRVEFYVSDDAITFHKVKVWNRLGNYPGDDPENPEYCGDENTATTTQRGSMDFYWSYSNSRCLCPGLNYRIRRNTTEIYLY